MTQEMFVQLLLAAMGGLLAVLGFAGTYILYAMKEEMISTRQEITSLANSVSSMVAIQGWHQKWLERHDEEILILRNNN